MRHPALAKWITRLAGATIILAGGSLALIGSPAVATSSPFDAPSSLAILGTHLFVANQANSSLTEVDAGTGALIATIPASTLKVSSPVAVVADDDKLFVAGQDGSIAVLSADGAFVSQVVVTGCGAAAALAVESTSTIIELCENGRINQLSTAGTTLTSMIKASVIKASEPTFIQATALAIEGTSAYVTFTTTSNASDGVAAFSLPSGTLTTAVDDSTNPSDAFAAPAGIAVAGKFLWITNAGTGGSSPSIEQLRRADLSFIISDSSSADLGTAGAVLAHHAPGSNDTDVYVATLQGTTAPMVSYYNPPLVQPATPTLSWRWMMCNTNASGTLINPNRHPYKFDHPSAFALYGSTLWVANAATDANNSPQPYATHVEAMDAETGAFLFNAS